MPNCQNLDSTGKSTPTVSPTATTLTLDDETTLVEFEGSQEELEDEANIMDFVFGDEIQAGDEIEAGGESEVSVDSDEEEGLPSQFHRLQ